MGTGRLFRNMFGEKDAVKIKIKYEYTDFNDETMEYQKC